MAKIISIGYSIKFLVPNSVLTSFVDILGDVRILEGSDSTGTVKPVEFEVKNPHPDLGREMSQREKELEKAAEDKNTMWYKEYNKVNELTKKLAESEAKINLLIEQGIKGAYCPQTVTGDAEHTVDIPNTRSNDEELPF